MFFFLNVFFVGFFGEQVERKEGTLRVCVVCSLSFGWAPLLISIVSFV